MMTTFDIDEKTGEAIDKLKSVYAVTSRAAVLKRALALAILCAKYSENGELRIKQGKRVRIISFF